MTRLAAARAPSRGLGATLLRLAPATLLYQLLAFGSSVVLATELGATASTDAYYLAFSAPVFAYAVLLAAIRLGAIPTLTEIDREESSGTFASVCSQVVTGTIAFAIVLSAVVTAMMLVVLPAVSGASAHFASLTRMYVVELSPYAVTGAAIGALSAILAVRGRFALPTLLLSCEPLMKSALVILFPGLGVQALVIGSLAGNLLAAVLLWGLVHRNGIALRLTAFWSSPILWRIFRLAGPLVIAQTVLQVNPLIDRTMAAGLASGSVTAFEFGLRLFVGPMTLLGAILIAPLAANWSARLAIEGWSPVADSFARVVAAVVLVVPPISAVGFLMREQLVGLIYHSHAYTSLDVSRTAAVFGFLLLGLTAQVLVVPISTLFVVRGDSVYPMKIALANVVLNVVLDWALRGPFGVGGIAVSTTLTYTLLGALYFYEAHRRWGSLHLRVVRGPVALSAVSCALVTVACLVVREHGGGASRGDEFLLVAVAVAVAAVIHGLAVLVWRAGTSRSKGGQRIAALSMRGAPNVAVLDGGTTVPDGLEAEGESVLSASPSRRTPPTHY